MDSFPSFESTSRIRLMRRTEYIKKRWQEYTEELYQKDLTDPDNHDDVVTN